MSSRATGSDFRARNAWVANGMVYALRDENQGSAISPKPALRPAPFRLGLVRIRSTAGRRLWQGELQSLSEASRLVPGHQVLLVEHLGTGQTFRAMGIR